MKEWSDQLQEEIEIETNALMRDCPVTVFEPSYHDGVCTTQDNDFRTWHEFAAFYGLDITDYIM